MSITARVTEYMSPDPLTLKVTDRILDAREQFVENRFTIAPIVDSDGRAIGVISATDLIRDTDQANTVAELMTGRIYATRMDESIVEAAAMMTDASVHHLIVLNDGRRPVGVISNSDVARAVADTDIVQPIRYIMSEELLTIDPGTSPEAAAAILEENQVSSAPIVQGGAVVGMVTKLGLLGSVGTAERVDELMDTDVHTVEPNAHIAEVARLFTEERARRVFVVDHDGDLLGMVTATDIAGYAASYLEDGQGITAD